MADAKADQLSSSTQRGIDAAKFSAHTRTIMPTGFDEAFGRIKELVADFRTNEKFYLSPQYCYTNRCDGLDRQIDALDDVLYQPAPRLRQAGALTPDQINIVEGAAKRNAYCNMN